LDYLRQNQQDTTIDASKFLGLLASNHLHYDLKGFEDTGHSPFEDLDRNEACQAAMDFLRSSKAQDASVV